MMDMYGMMGNMYGAMTLLNILFIGLIILVYLWIVKLWKEISKKR